jgi:hypothetical protein
MITGKRFKLQKPPQAVDVIDAERSAVTIPIGAIIEVAADPADGDGLVDVLWEGRIVVMFATDLNVRGAEITSQSATALSPSRG